MLILQLAVLFLQNPRGGSGGGSLPGSLAGLPSFLARATGSPHPHTYRCFGDFERVARRRTIATASTAAAWSRSLTPSTRWHGRLVDRRVGVACCHIAPPVCFNAEKDPLCGSEAAAGWQDAGALASSPTCALVQPYSPSRAWAPGT